MAEVYAGRWRVDRWMGRGRTSALGTDLQTQDNVVIKVLDLSQLDDWKQVELFEREAATLAALSHPQIPRLLDSFAAEDTRGFVMIQQFVDAQPVISLVEQPWDEPRLKAFAQSLLEILVYLHGFSPPVLHRDIEPANLLIDHEDVYLVDFGSVQRVVSRRVGGSTIVGTSGYLAPEQLTGTASNVSDLYGVGMVLVFLATGHSVNALRRQGLELVWHEQCRVPLSAGFMGFVDMLIAPQVEERIQSANQALHALEGPARSTAVVLSRPPNTKIQLSTNAQRLALKVRRGYWQGAIDSGGPFLIVVVLVAIIWPGFGWAFPVSWGGGTIILAALTSAYRFVSRSVESGELQMNRSGFRLSGLYGDITGELTEIRAIVPGRGKTRDQLSLATEHGVTLLATGLSLEERRWLGSELEQFLNAQGVYFDAKAKSEKD